MERGSYTEYREEAVADAERVGGGRRAALAQARGAAASAQHGGAAARRAARAHQCQLEGGDH